MPRPFMGRLGVHDSEWGTHVELKPDRMSRVVTYLIVAGWKDSLVAWQECTPI